MPYSKLKGLNRFVSVVVLGLVLKFVLSGVSSQSEFQGTLDKVKKIEGVESISRDAEAPGLLTLEVSYKGAPETLVNLLTTNFADKYQVGKKTLPSGTVEINLNAKK